MTDYQPLELAISMNELPLWSASSGLKLLDTIHFKANANVLDIGCGLGFPTLELAMRFGPSATVYGIDPWLDGLEYAKQKAELLNISNIRLLKQYAENLSFGDAFFDCIVSNNGLNNVQNIDMALLECARVAKPDAQLAFAMYTNESMKEFYDVFEQVLESYGLEISILAMQNHVADEKKSISQIESKLNKFGFRLISKIEDTFYLRFLDGTALLNHHFIRQVFYPVWHALVVESHQKQVFELLESKLNLLAKLNGELKLAIQFVVFDCEKPRKHLSLSTVKLLLSSHR